MAKLRFGLIGVGANVYNMHYPGLELDAVEVAAVCDLNEDALQAKTERWNCPGYVDYHDMIDNADLDIVVVMAPHTFHAEMTVYALRAGKHVLCEKPMGLHVGEADEMIRVAEETGKILAINFQQRTRPEISAAHEFLKSGGLGKIQHVDMKTTWTRTALYYKSSDWRGRFRGEGGALLMNQCPHDLDLICYLIGMPSQLFAWTPTIAHSIAAEDTAQAIFKWGNGALGTFHASTAESGQEQRFEIIGTKGHLQINKGGELRLRRFDTDIEEFLVTSDKQFAEPNMSEELLPIPDIEGGDHKAIYQNFIKAVNTGSPVIADGSTSIQGLELANAMIYSNYTDETVTFPLHREKYAALLTELIAKEAEQMG